MGSACTTAGGPVQDALAVGSGDDMHLEKPLSSIPGRILYGNCFYLDDIYDLREPTALQMKNGELHSCQSSSFIPPFPLDDFLVVQYLQCSFPYGDSRQDERNCGTPSDVRNNVRSVRRRRKKRALTVVSSRTAYSSDFLPSAPLSATSSRRTSRNPSTKHPISSPNTNAIHSLQNAPCNIMVSDEICDTLKEWWKRRELLRTIQF